MLSSWSATLSAKGLSSGTVQGITFPRTVRKFSSASYSRVIMFYICMTVEFIQFPLLRTPGERRSSSNAQETISRYVGGPS